MLPKEYRLRKMKDYEALFEEGGFVNGRLLGAKVWKIDPKKYEKRGYSSENLLIGFVVSTKVSKSAVKRNRLKRQMREVVRILLREGDMKSGYMIAFIAREQMIGKEYGDIQKDMIEILKKAKIYG